MTTTTDTDTAARYAAIRHEPWCDQQSHALLVDGFIYEEHDPLDGCVESIHTEALADGTEVVGWLHQDAEGAAPELFLEMAPYGWLRIDLSVDNVRGFADLLDKPGGAAGLRASLARALAALEQLAAAAAE